MSKTNESSLKSSESVPPPVCAMCLENLPGQNDYCKTSCGHEFHLSCMLTYTVKKGALRCVEATSVMCPLCRKELHYIPPDIDRCLSRFSPLSGFSFYGSTAAVAAPSLPFDASTTAATAPAVASSTTPSTTITSACDFTEAVPELSFIFDASTTAAPAPAIASATTPFTTITNARDFTADVAKLSFLFGASTTAAPAPVVASSTTIGNMADEDPFTFVETVDDNDDDDVDGAETAAMEATREKAEARKKRILEMANQRMNYVNGEQVDNGDADQKKSVSSAALNSGRETTTVRQKETGCFHHNGGNDDDNNNNKRSSSSSSRQS